MQIVWFKRDLRLFDNPALYGACQTGDKVLPLYIIEPGLWRQADMSRRHYLFLRDCLTDLNHDLSKAGQSLIIRVGDAVDVLDDITRQNPVTALWSNMETWNGWTYQRDLRVKDWAKTKAIQWHEPRQYGVIRQLNNRNGWAAKWQKQMQQAPLSAPQRLHPVTISSDAIPAPEQLGLPADNCRYRQKGGRKAALDTLNSFLRVRGEDYTKAMSSPVTAFSSCSRLSAYLAFGALSMREIFHAYNKRNAALTMMPREEKGRWPSAMRSFSGRLRWHCHFMQKLEDAPRIEFENMHSAYDGLRENDFNTDFFDAWKQGKTGYPMVDACMRALIATGWLNFRMRAMLVSFASYQLWLHWRKPALHLARLFTDYEPGIHYSQFQMQSGTTGINSIRIYNPIKQGLDHDPDGVFIREWVPELREMPTHYIHTPWDAPHLTGDYPLPIIDEKDARKSAAAKLYGLRRQTQHKDEARSIANKHGSRKSGIPSRMTRKDKRKDDQKQGELPL